ncbi:hypothetical protein BO78DRAFT_382540 [Aspergillus sclerotiicarbonarius CBS 121057]|uniref:Uncharacterized protein n=1 Tax=Aspergillus sclerotiicarbonarius (strain CBS 121057 / IBT 28362) TaxID=1448318 RepID=A0A319F0Q5_ASPSB|nr:hypothetical protein BO78DRAFT_382540 [Aspergillus sclerotiicarbonarius CBS 121057]
MPVPHLTHIFTLHIQAGPETLHAGTQTSNLSRHITSIEGGFLHGVPGTRSSGLDATLVPGGSDWILRDEVKNLIHVDVRTQGRTATGECVYIQYKGHLGLDETAVRFLRRDADSGVGSTEFGAHDWWIVPRFEFSYPEYNWVERTVFFGRGRFYLEGGVRAVE